MSNNSTKAQWSQKEYCTLKISLHDDQTIRQSDKGFSRAYFCRQNPVSINHSTIDELKMASKEIGGKSVRICLHQDPSDILHDMIVLNPREGYYIPHKHTFKNETYHIIEGKAALLTFTEVGKVETCEMLTPETNFLYRVAKDQFHTMVPLSEVVIYHEIRSGPFTPEGDSVYPQWAPVKDEVQKGIGYLADLVKKWVK